MKLSKHRAKFYLSFNYVPTHCFSVKIEVVKIKVKEPSHFSMLESKLWHNKAETENVKPAKIVEFIKTFDQYPCKFNFGHFFQLHNSPSFLLGKNSCLGK